MIALLLALMSVYLTSALKILAGLHIFFLSCLHYLDKPFQVSYFVTLSSSTHRLAGEGLKERK